MHPHPVGGDHGQPGAQPEQHRHEVEGAEAGG